MDKILLVVYITRKYDLYIKIDFVKDEQAITDEFVEHLARVAANSKNVQFHRVVIWKIIDEQSYVELTREINERCDIVECSKSIHVAVEELIKAKPRINFPYSIKLHLEQQFDPPRITSVDLLDDNFDRIKIKKQLAKEVFQNKCNLPLITQYGMLSLILDKDYFGD